MDAALTAALCGPRSANPLVGAAVLASDGTLVTGFHAGAGTAHAEVAALAAARSAGIDLSRATVCVTLEPCNHRGRTGPCAQLLIEAGVPEVVVALADPNPQAAGGIAALQEAGVRVRTGVGSASAAALNARWLRAVNQSRPYVTLKLAQSLDGRIAAADGTSQWITSPASRARVHRLRAHADSVLVGTGTALADDPKLTARLPETQTHAGHAVRHPGHRHEADPAQPVPAVMGMRDLPADSHLARNPRTLHLRTRDPLTGLRELRDSGVAHVLVEGGAQLAGALVRADLVDSLEIHLAPVLLGEGLPALSDLGVRTLAEAPRWLPDPAADWDHGPSGPSHPGSARPDAAHPGVARPDAAQADVILRLVPASAALHSPEQQTAAARSAPARADPALTDHSSADRAASHAHRTIPTTEPLTDKD